MIKYTDLTAGTSMLSPSVLHKSELGKAVHIPLSDLLSRKLAKSDNGFDVGTASYMTKSNFYFIKAKALQPDKFIPILDGEGSVPMNMKAFIDYKLRAGDLLISKDSNVGECVIVPEDLVNFMPCGALYRLPINKNKLYVFAYLKSKMFKKQLDALVPKGATIRHAGTKFLHCLVPFPTLNKEIKIKIVEELVQMIVSKEKRIHQNHLKINKIILNELVRNGANPFDVEFSKTHYKELIEANRIDASYYSNKAKFQKSLIQKYEFGYNTLEQLGYKMKRGQNLQVTNIGKSVYSKHAKPNFYTVIKPTNFTDYGTVADYEYLGNKNDLQTLNDGDIVFSAEGTVGKCVLFTNTGEKWITNIHGIVLSPSHSNISLSSYVSCILRFYKDWGFYDHFTVGGQGGSLGKNYWKDILIPKFPDSIVEELIQLYHSDHKAKTTSENILNDDEAWNSKVGIIELDYSIRKLKDLLESTLQKISNDDNFDVSEVYNKLQEHYNWHHNQN